MTSIGPYIQTTDMTHMYSFSDINSKIQPTVYVNPNSIMGILSNGDYTKFLQVVKIANMDYILKDLQANITLFAVPDNLINNITIENINKIDLSYARQIILGSLLKRQINGKILKYSPDAWYKTYINTIHITNNCNKFKINDNINIVLFDIQANNGIIHQIDNFIFPI